MEDRKKHSILIADELALVREGIVRLCESAGPYAVSEQCADGATALHLIQSRKIDVAILDLNLPRLFSLELVRRCREIDLPLKFILMSTRTDRKLVLEALRGGVSAFVMKSGPSRSLLDALNHVVSGGIYVSPELEIEKLFISQRKTDTQDPLETLSSREYQVFTLLIDGVRAKEIAARLELSPKTIDTYRASLMRKLDIHDVAGLVKFAIQREITTVM